MKDISSLKWRECLKIGKLNTIDPIELNKQLISRSPVIGYQRWSLMIALRIAVYLRLTRFDSRALREAHMKLTCLPVANRRQLESSYQTSEIVNACRCRVAFHRFKTRTSIKALFDSRSVESSEKILIKSMLQRSDPLNLIGSIAVRKSHFNKEVLEALNCSFLDFDQIFKV